MGKSGGGRNWRIRNGFGNCIGDECLRVAPGCRGAEAVRRWTASAGSKLVTRSRDDTYSAVKDLCSDLVSCSDWVVSDMLSKRESSETFVLSSPEPRLWLWFRSMILCFALPTTSAIPCIVLLKFLSSFLANVSFASATCCSCLACCTSSVRLSTVSDRG